MLSSIHKKKSFVPFNEFAKYSIAMRPPPKAHAIDDLPVYAPSANPKTPKLTPAKAPCKVAFIKGT